VSQEKKQQNTTTENKKNKKHVTLLLPMTATKKMLTAFHRAAKLFYHRPTGPGCGSLQRSLRPPEKWEAKGKGEEGKGNGNGGERRVEKR